MKFKKKPIVIEAFRYVASGDTNYQFYELMQYFNNPEQIFMDKDDGEIYINTLEGKMHVSSGDYVIKGPFGEFYPCKPNIFALTYEEVDEQTNK